MPGNVKVRQKIYTMVKIMGNLKMMFYHASLMANILTFKTKPVIFIM